MEYKDGNRCAVSRQACLPPLQDTGKVRQVGRVHEINIEDMIILVSLFLCLIFIV